MKQTRSLSEFSCLSEYTRLYPIGEKEHERGDICLVSKKKSFQSNEVFFVTVLALCDIFILDINGFLP